jgi:hypothetical protein
LRLSVDCCEQCHALLSSRSKQNDLLWRGLGLGLDPTCILQRAAAVQTSAGGEWGWDVPRMCSQMNVSVARCSRFSINQGALRFRGGAGMEWGDRFACSARRGTFGLRNWDPLSILPHGCVGHKVQQQCNQPGADEVRVWVSYGVGQFLPGFSPVLLKEEPGVS